MTSFDDGPADGGFVVVEGFLVPVARDLGDHFTFFVGQHQKPALGAGQADDGVHDDAQDLVQFKRRVDDLADVCQREQVFSLLGHRPDLEARAVQAGFHLGEFVKDAWGDAGANG